ncbi:MAG: M20/M25/M40 family metallo-hydrolase [Oscillospiraceae bacterium]|jgi:endoglucanase|nr:M20/M25/M40 family metallo-hydrolase [Oscillospiraceae bacterium]
MPFDFALLETLCAVDGVSSREDAVRAVLAELAEKHGLEHQTDAIGNLYVKKPGKNPGTHRRLMVCAHMDEVGVIVTGYERGYLKIAPCGGVDSAAVFGRTLRFEGGVTGLVTVPPPHLSKSDKTPEITAMYVDIGAEDEDAAKARVPLGTVGTFAQEAFSFGDGLYCAKAIDDRFGCAQIVGMFGEEFDGDIYFVFTVQEELGTRGALVAANVVKPDAALILESTTAVDYAGVTDADIVCRVGAGPVVPFMDGSVVPDKALRREIYSLAEKLGIAVQTKEKVAGGTDAGAIQRSGSGARVAVISLATRNLHSDSCVASKADMAACYRLSLEFCKSISSGEIEI